MNAGGSFVVDNEHNNCDVGESAMQIETHKILMIISMRT
jgi:hypothetical protein